MEQSGCTSAANTFTSGSDLSQRPTVSTGCAMLSERAKYAWVSRQ